MPMDEIRTEEERKEQEMTSAMKSKCLKIFGQMKSGAQKKPMMFRGVILVLSIAVGFGVKWVVSPRVTIGFQDYTVAHQSVFDFGAAEKRLADQAAQAASNPNGAPSTGIPAGGACSGL